MSYLIEGKDLLKCYHSGGKEIRVINNINISINKGEIITIVGASGSGKSTLLYLLSGIETLDSGCVKINGFDLSKLKEKEIARMRRQDMSFVYQFYNLIPNLSVYENIILSRRIDNKIGEQDKKYLEELCNLAGLTQLLDRRPQELSGGEQQRVAIIRSVFNRPQVVFADEPTGNLDSVSSKMVIDLIKEINKIYNTTIIMVTHSMEQAQIGDRIIQIKDGGIVA